MFSFQEDNCCVRGEVRVRLGDVIGEVVAYLVERTRVLTTSCIIRCDIVDINGLAPVVTSSSATSIIFDTVSDKTNVNRLQLSSSYPLCLFFMAKQSARNFSKIDIRASR